MRVGELAKVIGVRAGELSRLAGLGVIPAKRLPGERAHWRFAKADLPKIRGILVNAGLIEEEAVKKKK